MAKKETAPKSAPVAKPAGNDNLEYIALAYVVGAVLASAALNALANGRHAEDDYRPFAWGLGIAVPLGVLALGRVASLLYKRGCIGGACTIGAIAAVLLALSVVHCAESIALLTGSHWLLAAAMAVGIDAGLLACEACSTLAAAPRRKPARKSKAKSQPIGLAA